MLIHTSAIATTAALAIVSAAAPAFADEAPSGSAYALSVRAELLDAPLVKIDPVPKVTFPRGDDKSVAKIGPTAGDLVTAKLLNASSGKAQNALTSNASLAEVTVKDILHAELVTADCTAAGTNGATGESSIAKLTVLGHSIDLATAPNTKIDVVGVATVTINEQVKQGSALTVNAVHVTVGGTIHGVTKADIVLAQARCVAGSPGTETGTPTSSTTVPTTNTTSTSPTVPTTNTTSTTTPADISSSVIVGGNDSGNGPGGIDNAADSSDLAETGVSGVLPLMIGAVVLLAAGGGALVYTRRKRGTAGGPAGK